MHFKKYARKCSPVDINDEHFQEGLVTILENAVNIKTCSPFSILKNENWEWGRRIWHLAETFRGRISVTEKVLKIQLTIVEY